VKLDLRDATPATTEVFFDPSGRRWCRAKRATFFLIALIAMLISVSWGPIQDPPDQIGKRALQPLPELEGLDAPPMIGAGPLARLVRIEPQAQTKTAVDPLTGDPVGTLNSADIEAVGASQYALYRYGLDEGVHKTIMLTFDDGPDPHWTPAILDLLSQHKVPATFFVIGSTAVHHPELVKREVSEGHAIGNHTMTHPEVTVPLLKQEIVTTDRILASIAGIRTDLFRLPFYGNDPSKYDTEGVPILEAQRLGYVVSIHDFDTDDWKYGDPSSRPETPIPLPPTTADNITMLLHDGGGDRTATLEYLQRLIPWAQQNGYTFHSLPQVSTDVRSRTSTTAPTLWDRETLWFFQLRWTVADDLLRLLFWFAVIVVILGGVLNVLLAVARAVWGLLRSRSRPPSGRGPPVTAVVAAFNEQAVIAQCLEALCRTRYDRLVEIIVVDDGSTDATADIIEIMASWDSRIRLIRQPNRGKPKALNRAFAMAETDIVITLGADTVFTPYTVERLVRGFASDPHGRLGAVAGNVKVGNIGNTLTRWQALEYIMQIGVDRSAQELLRAIVVVPGACAAWRRQLVRRVGGFSSETLAEDCDLALQLQRNGYRVAQSVRAECFTEAPESFRQLSRQRFRWTYGNAQALWKHRLMILNPRFGWLGLVSLPAAALSLVMPVIFLPFVYLMAALMVSQHNGPLLLTYLAIFLGVQLIQALAGVALTRSHPAHLLIVPIYRLIAEPLRAYLLYKSALTVLRGTQSGWHKVTRQGSVRVQSPATAEIQP
jgi:cellulose synthase/poly-beta-1,6-N-acetylglucosamine synthase-like glycosyltransferase/peptidoglycan/xylan/chitin deacetylase (PgdA/CDA1 family)